LVAYTVDDVVRAAKLVPNVINARTAWGQTAGSNKYLQ
jgi:hypothetical protein